MRLPLATAHAGSVASATKGGSTRGEAVRRTRGRKPWPHTHRQHRLEDSMIKRIIDFLTLRWLWGRSRGRRRRR